MAIAPIPVRGEVWLVDFDPSVGYEIQKIRPAVVISLDSIGRLPLRMVVPITDWKSNYENFPWFTKIETDQFNGLIKDSGADAFQTKSLSLDRFVRPIGTLTHEQLEEISNSIALCVGAP